VREDLLGEVGHGDSLDVRSINLFLTTFKGWRHGAWRRALGSLGQDAQNPSVAPAVLAREKKQVFLPPSSISLHGLVVGDFNACV